MRRSICALSLLLAAPGVNLVSVATICPPIQQSARNCPLLTGTPVNWNIGCGRFV